MLSDTQLEYTVKTGEVDSHILPSLAAHHQDSVDVHGPSVVCLPLGIVEPDIAPWCASHAATGEELRRFTGHPGGQNCIVDTKPAPVRGEVDVHVPPILPVHQVEEGVGGSEQMMAKSPLTPEATKETSSWQQRRSLNMPFTNLLGGNMGVDLVPPVPRHCRSPQPPGVGEWELDPSCWHP